MAANPLAGATTASFRTLSRLRGRRFFHPHGVGFAAELRPSARESTGAELFDAGTARPAIVRLSRSLGLPEALPDPCGLAIRFPAAYGSGRDQDFLLVTSAQPVVVRHLVAPAAGFSERAYSSLAPYRVRGQLRIFAALPTSPSPGPKLADLRARQHGGLEYELAFATPAGGWAPLGRLALGERLPDPEVERAGFDPRNTGGGIELAGIVNWLRLPAYAGSRIGRGADAPEGSSAVATDAASASAEARAAGAEPLRSRGRAPRPRRPRRTRG